MEPGESRESQKEVLLISDALGIGSLSYPDFLLTAVDESVIPSADELAGVEAAVILGPCTNGDRAMELGGAVKLALERGATVAFLYNARLAQADGRFLAAVQEVQ